MRILIVDDSPFLRMTLKKILIEAGFTIAGEANDGDDAVRKFKELSPDLVTLDITMPGKSGLEALREIMKFDDKAKIIMCSAMGRTDFITEAMKYGALGFITKPFKSEKIINEIKKIKKNS